MVVASYRYRLHGLRWVVIGVACTLLICFFRGFQLQQQSFPLTTDDARLASGSFASSVNKPTQSVSEPQSLGIGTPPSEETKFHIVISHYKEEPFYIGRMLSSLRGISSILGLGIHATIYTKGLTADLESLLKVSTADRVISLSNVG